MPSIAKMCAIFKKILFFYRRIQHPCEQQKNQKMHISLNLSQNPGTHSPPDQAVQALPTVAESPDPCHALSAHTACPSQAMYRSVSCRCLPSRRAGTGRRCLRDPERTVMGGAATRPRRSGPAFAHGRKKAPPERGWQDRGAEAPTVELLKPGLRRSTRRTGSRSRRRTRRRRPGRSCRGSCPRWSGCRPATGRCRRRPA